MTGRHWRHWRHGRYGRHGHGADFGAAAERDWREEGDAARDAAYESPNPHRLYRNTEAAVLWGVAAGVADYFGTEHWKVRVLLVIGLIFFLPQVALAYVVAALVLKPRPRRLYRDTEEERFWRSVSGQPTDTFHGLRHKFRDLEQRLAEMERTVTSDEYRLDREIRNLER